MFEKTLQDLVKGIRSTKGDVSVYISQCLQEIKAELRSTDPFLKAEAVRKLTYLHMLGYDMGWAAFHIVEVMSSERFAHKRIGNTAACQSFTQHTDVVLLCTNLLKKEFSSSNDYDVGLALNVLGNIATPDLARDLLGDVLNMLQSPKSYVRKKATLVLYKLFLRYPQGLRLSFDRLREKMEEPDVSVVSCAVNVICELADKKPQNYLGLAPHFFRLLTTSSNNWMLIKVVKLLRSLVPVEPRLARKLLDPLATVIQNTPAKSLLYECINTVTTALLYTRKSDGSQPKSVPAVVKLCNTHLRRFLEDSDQNLRYLGLIGLGNLMQSHMDVLEEHQSLIIECLYLDDITIRLRALELLAGMVHTDNASTIVSELLRQVFVADGVYRQELMHQILHVCSRDKYANVHDFDWYISVLCQLARVPETTSDGKGHGQEVSRQLVDLAVRVKGIRANMVESMLDLLFEQEMLTGPSASTVKQVYFAASWIVGEYVSEYLEEEEGEERIEDLVETLVDPQVVCLLPSHVQAAIVQTLLKLLAVLFDRLEEDEAEEVASTVLKHLDLFLGSEYVEVQERSVALKELLLGLGIGYDALEAEERQSRALEASGRDVEVLHIFFRERLAPVGIKAQKKVPVPEGLDLERPVDEEEAAFLLRGDESKEEGDVSFVQTMDVGGSYVSMESASVASSKSSRKKVESESESDSDASGKKSAASDPFYLSSRKDEEETHVSRGLERAFKKSRSRKKRAVLEEELMPDGADDSPEETPLRPKRSENDLADVDLSVPLGKHERIPDDQWKHRSSSKPKKSKDKKPKDKKHKDKKHKDKDKKHKDRKSRKSRETEEPLLLL